MFICAHLRMWCIDEVWKCCVNRAIFKTMFSHINRCDLCETLTSPTCQKALVHALTWWLHLVLQLVMASNPINHFLFFYHSCVLHICEPKPPICFFFFFLFELINPKTFKLIISNLHHLINLRKTSKKNKKIQPIDLIFCTLLGLQFMICTI